MTTKPQAPRPKGHVCLIHLKSYSYYFRFLTSHIGGLEAGRRPAPAPPEYSCAQAAPSTRPEADKEAARRTCWLGIPKIELSVFVPGPWVVFGASPERRFSHAAITCTETFTLCKDHSSSVVMQIP